MNSFPFVERKAQHVKIRELKPSDVEALFLLSNDPEVVRFVHWPMKTREDLAKFVGGAISRRDKLPRLEYPLAVEDNLGGKLVGLIKFAITDEENLAAEINGYALKPFWGRGLATDVGKLILDFGFKELGLRRIFAHCDTANVASARVLEKLGMKQEGTIRSRLKLNGEWRDSYLYSVLFPEWKGMQ